MLTLIRVNLRHKDQSNEMQMVQPSGLANCQQEEKQPRTKSGCNEERQSLSRTLQHGLRRDDGGTRHASGNGTVWNSLRNLWQLKRCDPGAAAELDGVGGETSCRSSPEWREVRRSVGRVGLCCKRLSSCQWYYDSLVACWFFARSWSGDVRTDDCFPS